MPFTLSFAAPCRSMPPTRTKDNKKEGSSKTRSTPSKTREHINKLQNDTSIQGVQKIKSSLRQTRRLLAKDKLAADVRVETERRLKALETELHRAELANKERAFAVRYHKIKFFERKKVMRKIQQTQKQLTTAEIVLKRKLETDLNNLRVDLNYILHFPRLKKYISLFPPEVRNGEVQPASSNDVEKTNVTREEIRSWVRDCMDKGELSSEPELHLDKKTAINQHPSPWDVVNDPIQADSTSKVISDVEKDTFFEDEESDTS